MTLTLPSNPSRNGVYRLPASGVDALISQAATRGFTVHRVDLKGLRASRENLVALGKSLDFPQWYGANFDALADCLCDPDWQPVGAQILLITGADSWRRAHPRQVQSLAVDHLRCTTDIDTQVDVARLAAEHGVSLAWVQSP